MAEQTKRDARPCIYLASLIELCLCEHSPVEVLCSFLAMCWFWTDCVKEGKDIFLNSTLLTLHRLLRTSWPNCWRKLLPAWPARMLQKDRFSWYQKLLYLYEGGLTPNQFLPNNFSLLIALVLISEELTSLN